MKEGLSFDDVLVSPRKGIVNSRDDVDLGITLGKISLKNPLISTNMDTVTESEMAIAMAREGGLGIIHRFMGVEEQVKNVNRVKRDMNFLIEKPATIDLNEKISRAREITHDHDVGGILVTENGNLVGIISTRDLLFQEDSVLVKDLMSKEIITADYGISLEEAKRKLHQHRIEKLPLIHDGKLAGLITIKDIMKREKSPYAALDKRGRLLVGAAIGVKGDYLDRCKALVESGCDVICVDIAHGHSEFSVKTVKEVKDLFPRVHVMAGNVATTNGFKELVDAGADSIKVGVGGASICTTRVVSGCGVPQLTAIMDCFEASKDSGIPIIGDGGTKNSGDVVKALVAGSTAVMIGSQFAGTKEAPGKIVLRNGRRFKIYRGSTSFEASVGRKLREGENNVLDFMDEIVPEGVESFVPYKGPVVDIIKQLLGGVKSGISYCGVKSVKETVGLQNFVKMTSMGLRESHAHDVDVMK